MDDNEIYAEGGICWWTNITMDIGMWFLHKITYKTITYYHHLLSFAKQTVRIFFSRARIPIR